MPKRGELHHKAKLTEEQVRQIRKWRAEGLSYAKIGERLNWLVCNDTIYMAATGQTWSHVR